MPKETPILFSTPMVKAILDGRKTMTRRVIKPQPQRGDRLEETMIEGEKSGLWSSRGDSVSFLDIIKCPYGKIGDRLWVRETWGTNKGNPKRVFYKADGNSVDDIMEKWRPSIHMFRWASRITLEITNIKVERVRDITDDDAKNEGVGDPYDYQNEDYYDVMDFDGVEINKCAFAGLWDSLNEKRGHGWDANPFVWAITFRRINHAPNSD